VESDHLDHYGTFEHLRAAFDAFVGQATEGSVVSADDAEAAAIGRAHGSWSVGTASDALFTMTDISLSRSSASFTLHGPDGELGPLTLGVPGLHNARNAALAVTTALQVGVPFGGGVGPGPVRRGDRRFEFRGEANGVTFVDDYAHLPFAVRAALATARIGGWSRVVAVFQPHRYTRTAELAEQFGSAFADADALVVTDVYSAGEAPVPGVSGRLVADAVRAQDQRLPVAYAPTWEELRQVVGSMLRPGDLCLTLGAGDLTHCPTSCSNRPVVTSGTKGDVYDALADALGSVAAPNQPLGPLTTYGVGGPGRAPGRGGRSR
jgi:UDP-N-acetylmuramate--alanine ligase